MKIQLKIWRQLNAQTPGKFVQYKLDNVNPDMSFLEMLDLLNQRLIKNKEDPIAFEHDCREGICGSCSLVINGNVHGPELLTTTCQLHMRKFKEGASIVVEPFRAKPFKIIKDLIVDRSSLDRIMQAGGFISLNTGSAPEANTTRISKENSDLAMDSAACIGCGACVASCPNGSINLFIAAKLAHLSFLPQGQIEQNERALKMFSQAEKEGFGTCSNTGSCAKSCPKGITLETIARMNRQIMSASITKRPAGTKPEGD